MDPLLEVTLAGDLLQFLGLATKLLTSSGELYRKVELEAQNIIAASIRQVQNFAVSAIEQCRVCEFSSVSLWGRTVVLDECKLQRGFHPDRSQTSAIEELCRECHEAAQILDENLNKLLEPDHLPRRGWRSLLLALIGVSSKKDIEALTQRLKDARSLVETKVIRDLSTTITSQKISQSPRFHALYKENQELILALLDSQATLDDNRQAQTAALCLLLSNLEVVFLDGEDITQIVSDAFLPTLEQNPILSSSKQTELKRRKEVSRQILSSLVVDTGDLQNEDIPDAQRRTYGRLLSDSKSGSHSHDNAWSDFRTWLWEGTGVYWIHGREASGKSTLMRSIVSNSQTSRLLRGWASAGDGSKLCMSEFFYCSTGTADQRSQSGLFRQILYALLEGEPQLAPIVFPTEYAIAYCNSMGYSSLVHVSPNNLDTCGAYSPVTRKFTWSLPPLYGAVRGLFLQSQIPLRACLFIDGFDEFDGSQIELAELFQLVANNVNIKCCVSSRSSSLLRSAFAQQSQLQLEALTYQDMAGFIVGRLRADRRIERIAAADLSSFQAVVQELVASAKGSFLWLHLAVGSLLRSHEDHDGIADLYTRLRAMPVHLPDLYNHIIAEISRTRRQDTYRLLQLVTAASTSLPDDWRIVSPLSLLCLSFASEDDPTLALTATLQFLTRADIQRRCEETAARIQSGCAGLLLLQQLDRKDDRISPIMTVTFSHPSLKDYFTRDETQVLLRRLAPDVNFNPSFAILKAKILLMKSEQRVSSSDRLSYHHVDEGILYARRTEAELGYRDDLNQTISELIYTGENWFRLNTISQPIFHPNCTKYTIAVQCGLVNYLRYLLSEDNIISREHPKRTGKRTLLSLTLLPPSGFEDFVSPQVVEILLEFGADATEASQLIVPFLARWKSPRKAANAAAWKPLLKKLVPGAKQIYEDDVQALKTMYEENSEDWADIQRAIQGLKIKSHPQVAAHKDSEKPRRRILCF